MDDALLISVLVAFVGFWAVGAHNRLVRLRSLVLKAADELALCIQDWLDFLTTLDLDDLTREGTVEAENLRAGCNSLALALSEFRVSRWTHEEAERLGHACDEIIAAWQSIDSAPADLAGEPLPPDLRFQWSRLSTEVERARSAYRQQVNQYNCAIRQFPARILARVLRFNSTAWV